MTLDTSIAGWNKELNHSAAHMQPLLATLNRAKMRYQGMDYRSGEGENDPHNHALMWFSLMRSQLLIGNPRVRWTSDLEGNPAARALALTHACNQVSKRSRLRDLNEQLLMDFGFKGCVCLVTSAPAPGMANTTDAKRWPAGYRIPLDQFRYDVAAVRQEQRAWSGHLVIASRSKLMEQARAGKGHWNIDALQDEDAATSNVNKWRPGKDVPDRDEIAYWEIWAPGEGDGDPKKGYNGRIFTVLDNQSDANPIRDPFNWFGPPWGPYQLGGDLLVPDESFPMGPITATAQQAAYLNRIKRATARAIENYKQFTVVSDNALAEMIKNSEDQYVYGFNGPNLRDGIVPMVQGGATDQHFVAQEDAMKTLEEASGFTDIMKGIVNPNNKATADALAAQSAGIRTSGTVSKFHDLITRILYTFGWYIDRDDEIEIELGPQAAGMFVDKRGKPTTRLRGGLAKDQDPEEFFALDLDLQVGSMERDLEADTAHRMGVRSGFVQEMVALGATPAPLWLDVAQYAKDIEEDTGVRGLSKLIDAAKMTAVAGLMIQQPQAAPPTPTAGPQPKFSGSLPNQMAAKSGASGAQKPAGASKAAPKMGTSTGSGKNQLTSATAGSR